MATAGSPRRHREPERALTPEWLDNTQRILAHAADQKSRSVNLREASTSVRATMDRETKTRTDAVNMLLKDKVQETATWKHKLEATHVQIVAEMRALEDTRTHVNQVLEARAGPLRVAEQRARTRRQRPPRESIHDTVERALHLQTLSLQEACDELRSGVHKAEEHWSRMDKCAKQLAADIADKTSSLALDEECLNVAPPSHNVGLSASMNQAAAAANLTPKRSKVVPEQWRGSSQRLIETATQLVDQSQQLCKALRKIAKSAMERNDRAADGVQQSLQHKVRQTDKLRVDLQKRLGEVMNEIASLEEQQMVLTASLEEKNKPLAVLKSRLSIRRKRPQREAVRDRVEEAMEMELTKLNTAVTELLRKLATVEKQLKELQVDRTELERDLSDKTAALQLDRTCIGLQSSLVGSPVVGYQSVGVHADHSARLASVDNTPRSSRAPSVALGAAGSPRSPHSPRTPRAGLILGSGLA